jgi:hypothetical protein
MDRTAAKIKIAVLLANYVRVPRGEKKLATGTVDRLVDRLLGDEFAARDLVELDPNSYSSAAAFVSRYRDLFRGASRPAARPDESLAEEASRRLNAAIDAARDRYAAALSRPTAVATAGGLPDPEPTLSPEEEARVAERALELVVEADDVLGYYETVGSLYRAIRFELDLAGKLGSYAAFGRLLGRLGFAVAGAGENARVGIE